MTTNNHNFEVLAPTLIYSTVDTELASDEVTPSNKGETTSYKVADETCEEIGKGADEHPREAPRRQESLQNMNPHTIHV